MKKKKRLSGIERRWFVNNVGVIMLLVAACVFCVVFSVAAYYDTNLRSGLENKAKTTTDFFSNYISQSYKEYYQSCIKFAQTFEEKDLPELQFISANGKLVASSYGKFAGRSASTPEIQQAIDSQQIRHYKGRNPLTGERILAVSSPMIYTNGEVIGVLRYVTALHEADRSVLVSMAVAIGVALLCVGLAIFSNAIFINNVVEPVAVVSDAARRISAGSYGILIDNHYRDELGELVDNFNDLSLKISLAEKIQLEFVSSVSRELRTPLTAISGWAETLSADPGANIDQTKRGLGIILKESRRLTTMVEELLEFTKMQDGRFTLRVESVDLASELEDAIYTYFELFRQEGIEVSYKGPDEDVPPIVADSERMKQVFCNVLDNAAKHGGSGKRIDVSVAAENGSMVIRVRDFGPGIPVEELPYVKQKFYKGSSKARGSGSGLAVTEEIVVLHGGTLDIASAVGEGTTVTVTLPAAKAEEALGITGAPSRTEEEP